MKNERWRPVVNWEQYYEVSNLGRVRRIKSGLGTVIGYVLKPLRKAHGYMFVSLCRHGKKIDKLIHRLVLEAFIGLKLDRKECNHKDGNKANNTLNNLEWVNRSENMLHSFEVLKNKGPYGVKSHSAKLNEINVRKILQQLKEGQLQKDIAKNFGVAESTISSIKLNRTWKNLER